MASAKASEDSKVAVASSAAVHLDAAVFGASVQLPAFDKVEAETWFAVADANFALRKVTDSTTKYYYVLSKLDASTLRKLSSFIKRPKGDDPYSEIKEELCEAYEPPLEKKLDSLLTIGDMGDESPKEYGMEIRRLAADATLDDVLKRIFIRGLPRSVVTAITGNLGASFSTVITVANRAWTASSSTNEQSASVAAVSAPQGAGSRRGARGSRGGRQRGAKQSGGQTRTVTLCHFHLKFGDAAKRCAPSCSRFNENRTRDSQAPQVFQVEELDGEDAQEDTASGNE